MLVTPTGDVELWTIDSTISTLSTVAALDSGNGILGVAIADVDRNGCNDVVLVSATQVSALASSPATPAASRHYVSVLLFESPTHLPFGAVLVCCFVPPLTHYPPMGCYWFTISRIRSWFTLE